MKDNFHHLATFRVPDPKTMCYGGPRYGCFAVPYSRPFLFGKNPEYWIEAKAADDVCTWDTVDVKVQYREFATGNIKTMRPDWEDLIFIRSMFFDTGETVHMYVPGKLGHEPHVLRMWTPGRAMGSVETPYSRNHADDKNQYATPIGPFGMVEKLMEAEELKSTNESNT